MKRYFLTKFLCLVFTFSLMPLCQVEAQTFQLQEGKAALIVTLKLPQGYQFIPKAPFVIECQTTSAKIIALPKKLPKKFDPLSGPYKIPFRARTGAAIITLKTKIYYCHQSSKMCFQDVLEAKLPFVVTTQGSSAVHYTWNITPKNIRASSAPQAPN